MFKIFKGKKTEDKEYEFETVVEQLRQPQTIKEVINWIHRAGKDEIFHIHDDLYSEEESNVIYVTVANNIKNFGLTPISGTHAIPRLREEGKEMENLVGFLYSFGVKPDW